MMRDAVVTGILGLCVTAAGCSSDEAPEPLFPATQECGLRVGLSGAVNATGTGTDREWQCSAHPGDPGLIASFRSPADAARPGPIEELTTFSLDVDGVAKGATGRAFHTQVQLQTTYVKLFTAMTCEVDIVEYAVLRKNESGASIYRIVGAGACASPATSAAADTDIDVAPFEFVTLLAHAEPK